MDLTPKQQASEAIRQAESILIMTGSHPSVDQAAAVIGLSAILRKFGKRVSAVMSEGLPAAVAGLDTAVVERQVGGLRDFVLKLDVTKAEVDKLRYEVLDGKLNIFITPFKGAFAPSDVTFDYGAPNFEYDLAIVLGVPTRARIDRAYEQNLALFEQIPLVNLDFHRSNEGYGAVNLIDGNASSLCEMLVATSESLQSGLIDAEIGTTLLMGIMAATDRFTAAHTTSKSLTVAAQMMAAGGRQPAVVKALYRDGRGGDGRSGGSDGRSGGDGRSDGRGGERQGGSDRRGGDRGRGGQSQPAERRGANEQRTTHDARPAAHQPERRVEPETPSAAASTDRVAGAASTDRPWREEALPIIDPGHIELSEPVETREPAVVAEAPVAGEPPTTFEPEVPTAEEPAQERPVMADFAAAAEVLAQRRPDEPVQPDQTSA